MKNTLLSGLITVLVAVSMLVNGCGAHDPLDPTQIGRFRPIPIVNVILSSLGVAEEETPVFEGAEEPRPTDVLPLEEDYRFGSGDAVRIAIFELLQEGAMFVNDYAISETGRISIPEVGQVSVAGLTEAELEDEIKQILSPTILKKPTVTVALLASQRRAFTILGQGVPRPSRYPLPRFTFRLTDALAVAGSPSQFNVTYIYVSRALTGREELAEEPLAEPARLPERVEKELLEVDLRPVKPEVPVVEDRRAEEEMLEIIAPYAAGNPGSDSILISSAEMVTDSELEEIIAPEGFETGEIEDTIDSKNEAESEQPAIGPQGPSRIEWIFKDGKWTPVRVGQEPVVVRPERKKPVMPPVQAPEYFGWEQLGVAGVQRRVIKIPVKKLLSGDPRYDVVIRPGDTIAVPIDMVGEAWVYGNVNRVGAINLTGRPMTLMQLMAAAGGLGPLAWPKKVEVRRRISEGAEAREEIVLVNLDKISKGTQPDFFIKPHDLINVGTHPAARHLAVLRNAFRAAYGFGFVYDRNFLTTRSGQVRLLYD